ncbi:hypothetical protein GQF01_13045 [Paenibacillus sp. 5J-6]|uniref:Chloramphenicol acetyltransferase n=1 Tax=Paenibacillus silvestris TaxID=2606219 RepID=A0A6L8UXS1_9BACL|nr:ATP-binding protein [Paenibacillus silvestris]MZQ83033.1 hypothetical protein [Paenibacillus silvestris]
MKVISIEGASAAGKTSTSSLLTSKYNGFHIPEVNTWWKRPDHVYPEWFFERQVNRWEIAREKMRDYDFIVIDIDLFQPFWYNWAFDFTLFGGQSLDFVADFYRKQFLAKKIGFPDKYYILSTSEAELRRRKANDLTRRRGGFELNLGFIEPQKHYFKALNAFIPNLVCFIESVSIDENVKQIHESLPSQVQEHTYSIELFEFMVDWLRKNKASDFVKSS